MYSLSIVITIASLASVSLAEYRPEERLVLADCGIHPPKGDSTSRQIMYYPTAPWASPGTRGKWVTPQMMTDVPWDGSYPWRKSGLKRTMPNGDEFTIVIDPSIPDSDTQAAGLASHRFEPHGFLCRGHHERGIYTLDDGTECASAYVCDHKPANSPNPAPAPPAGKTTSTLTLSSDAIFVTDSSLNKIELKLPNPNDVFYSVYNAIEGNGCRTSRFDVGDSCTISYRCMFAGETNVIKPHSDAVAKFLHGTAGPQVAKSWYEKTTYSSQWGIPKYWIGYKYPRNGQIVITHDNSVQSQLSFEIACKGSWFCDVACSGVTAGMLSLSSAAGLAPAEVFGALTAGACGAFC